MHELSNHHTEGVAIVTHAVLRRQTLVELRHKLECSVTNTSTASKFSGLRDQTNELFRCVYDLYGWHGCDSITSTSTDHTC